MHDADLPCAWGFYCGETMRDGYILLHRQGLTQDEWKHPLRTLAWIDFLTMAAWKEFIDNDGVTIRRGEVIASYSFLANRWHVSKDTAFTWIKFWIAERQVERLTERCTERHAERFFIVNYAKYQDIAERCTERHAERLTERSAERMKRIQIKENNKKEIYDTDLSADADAQVVDELEMEYRQFLPIVSKLLGHKKVFTSEGLKKWKARRKKWSARDLGEAFLNLQREPDRWKISHNGHRELSWWLASDTRILDMQNCHLKGSSSPILSADI